MTYKIVYEKMLYLIIIKDRLIYYIFFDLLD